MTAFTPNFKCFKPCLSLISRLDTANMNTINKAIISYIYTSFCVLSYYQVYFSLFEYSDLDDTNTYIVLILILIILVLILILELEISAHIAH